MAWWFEKRKEAGKLGRLKFWAELLNEWQLTSNDLWRLEESIRRPFISLLALGIVDDVTDEEAGEMSRYARKDEMNRVVSPHAGVYREAFCASRSDASPNIDQWLRHLIEALSSLILCEKIVELSWWEEEEVGSSADSLVNQSAIPCIHFDGIPPFWQAIYHWNDLDIHPTNVQRSIRM